MIASVVLLGILLYYMNKRPPAAAVSPESSIEVLDTMDVTRYRSEPAVQVTDY